MNIHWHIEDQEIERLQAFVRRYDNAFVASRVARNVDRQGIVLDRNSLIHALLMGLLTSRQRSGPDTPVSNFLRTKPFPVTAENLRDAPDTEAFARDVLRQYGLNRYINRIAGFFARDYHYLQASDWALLQDLSALSKEGGNAEERRLADKVDDVFTGFGPKQARNFLQALGLTRYEIPIDSRTTAWLNEFGFPVTVSAGAALQDKGYYHFVSDGIQQLCARAGIYPCVLDAAIFSSYDKEQWTEKNIVY